jgi:N-methylhydantoinase A
MTDTKDQTTMTDIPTGLRFGVDTGGTFTDLVIEGLPGGLRFFKRPTTRTDPVRGLLDVIGAAAADLGTDPQALLARGDMFIHGTTRATNAIVEGATARTALLTTEGHRDVLLLREGGGRIQPMDYTQRYPDPYVPRALTFEVPERIGADGGVRRALDEAAVVDILRRLREDAVEAVAVCLLWSVVNPAHEERVGALVAEHLPGVPYTLSHALNPTIREYRRASSAAIDASLKPLMSRYIGDLDRRLRDAGFGGRLLILTSSGGVLDAEEVWETPIHSIGSGPAAAPVGGRHFARTDAGSDYAIVTDAGGTTYDVGLIRHGQIPWTRETMVGHPKQGHMTGFPSVDVRSGGAGGGSIGWVDEGGLLHVGPQSAGADPGPVCWGRGGTRPTVTDACVVLGYLDPDYFLGGEMRIDRAMAEEAIRRDVAGPLGLDTDQAAAAILDLACERMVTAIEEITLNQGLDPRAAVTVGGGGGAGLYAAAIARRLGSRQVVIPAVSAALSAAGALLSELTRDVQRTRLANTRAFDFELANTTIAELREECAAFRAGPGAAAVESRVVLSVEARYPNQVWEIEVPLPVERFDGPADVAALEEAFHRVHEELFAFADRGSHVEIVAWRAQIRCTLHADADVSISAAGDHGAEARTRTAYFSGAGLVEAEVHRFSSLVEHEAVAGPAIVESPVTTLVVPPGATVERLASGSLLLDPGVAAAQPAVLAAKERA